MLRKTLILIGALFYSWTVQAQFVAGTGAARSAPVNPSKIMPPGKEYVDLTTMAGKRSGFTDHRAAVWCTGAYSDNDAHGLAVPAGSCGSNIAGHDGDAGATDGAFRISCFFSHFGFEDPIVFPGRTGMSHIHTFFGNDTTGSFSDLQNMAHVGTSTCNGGLFNRSGYWVSSLLYQCPNPTISGCDGKRHGHLYIPTNNEVYYKTGLIPAQPPVTAEEWPPEGFRMIGGSATATSIQGRHFFACLGFDPAIGGINNVNYTPARIPSSVEAAALPYTCTELLQAVLFPQCWNGVDLDSPDHQSHVIEIDPSASPGPKCQNAGFQHLFPSISYNVHYNISIPDLDYLRLSSDPPETTGTTQTSIDATHVKLAASESAIANYYQWGMLFIGGTGRQILSWDSTTKVATLRSAFPSGMPAAGTTYAVRVPGGMTTHGDWVGGWDQTTPLAPGGLTVTNEILTKCLHVLADCHDSAIRDANPAHDRNTDPSNAQWFLLYGR
jgi:hypothetical protein